MRKVFILFATVITIVWGGTNLWLAGYEQGYTEGEDSAWDRANSARDLITEYPRPETRSVQLEDQLTVEYQDQAPATTQ